MYELKKKKKKFDIFCENPRLYYEPINYPKITFSTLIFKALQYSANK